MPSEHQTIFTNQPAAIADGTVGHANKDTLRDGFPASPLHTFVTIPDVETGTYDADGSPVFTSLTIAPNILGEATYRKFYSDFVMDGSKNIPGSSFSHGVSMDYGDNFTLVDHGHKTPEDGVQAGLPGSSISATGLGPNVNTLDIDNPSNPADGLDVIEPSVGAAKTHPNPKSTSKKIGEGGMYGDKSLPGASGILGESAVGDLEEL